MNEGAFEYFIVICICCHEELAHLGLLDHVANQIIPECKLHAPALVFMFRTSKTLRTDRGPPHLVMAFPQASNFVRSSYIYIGHFMVAGSSAKFHFYSFQVHVGQEEVFSVDWPGFGF